MAIAERLLVLDPTIEPEAGGLELAPRPDGLDGKIVALLDNSKPNLKFNPIRFAKFAG